MTPCFFEQFLILFLNPLLVSRHQFFGFFLAFFLAFFFCHFYRILCLCISSYLCAIVPLWFSLYICINLILFLDLLEPQVINALQIALTWFLITWLSGSMVLPFEILLFVPKQGLTLLYLFVPLNLIEREGRLIWRRHSYNFHIITTVI